MAVRRLPSNIVLPQEPPVLTAQVGGASFAYREAGYNGSESAGLWVTDADQEQLEAERFVAELDGNLTSFTSFNSELWFLLDGKELWKSDGTLEGTSLVQAFQSASELEVHEDTLFFVADDGRHGREVWRTDGTIAGTQLAVDVLPGLNGSAPRELTVVGDSVFFSAEDGIHGRELWRIATDSIAGDFDDDGVVGFSDFLILAESFGKPTDEEGSRGDLNGDGVTSFADFLLLSANFGKSA